MNQTQKINRSNNFTKKSKNSKKVVKFDLGRTVEKEWAYFSNEGSLNPATERYWSNLSKGKTNKVFSIKFISQLNILKSGRKKVNKRSGMKSC